MPHQQLKNILNMCNAAANAFAAFFWLLSTFMNRKVSSQERLIGYQLSDSDFAIGRKLGQPRVYMRLDGKDIIGTLSLQSRLSAIAAFCAFCAAACQTAGLLI